MGVRLSLLCNVRLSEGGNGDSATTVSIREKADLIPVNNHFLTSSSIHMSRVKGRDRCQGSRAVLMVPM